MSLSIRNATRADVSRIVALMNAAFRGRAGEPPGWSTEAGYITGDRTTEPLLLDEMTGGAEVLVVDGEGHARLDGCVTLKPISSEKWYLGSVAVEPALQNSGLGRRLLSAAEDYSALRGACSLEITVVNVRDTLICWYERRSYHRTGEIRPFPYGDDRFGRPLRDDLAFVVLEKVLHLRTNRE